MILTQGIECKFQDSVGLGSARLNDSVPGCLDPQGSEVDPMAPQYGP